MYEIEKQNYAPQNIFAGGYPVAISIEKAKSKVEKNTIVAMGEGGVEAASGTNLANIYGITVDGAEAGEEVALYLTGEFRAEEINFPTGAELAKVKAPLRKLSIFIK